MGTSTLVVARTDAEAATYLTSNIDHRDHGYILGASVPMDSTLNAATMSARAAGQADIEAVEAQWMATAKLDTFPKLVAKAIGDDAAKVRATPPLPAPSPARCRTRRLNDPSTSCTCQGVLTPASLLLALSCLRLPC